MFGTTRPRRLGTVVAVATAATIAVAPAALASSVTGKNVQLPRGYVISGYVKTAGGAALQNVGVNAGGAAGAGFANTNASGFYQLVGLAPGSYKIQFFAPFGTNVYGGYYTTSTSSHTTLSSSSATSVTVGPNRTGINANLPAGLTVSGFVKNHSGTPVPGYEIAIQGVGGSEATTSSTGAYTVRGLAPGTYKAYVIAPEASAYISGGYTGANSYHFTTAVSGLQTFTLSASRSSFNFGVTTGYTVSGTIETSGGAPMAGVSVDVGASGSLAGNSATTNSSGGYAVKGIPAGTSWKISIDPQGEYPTRMSGFYSATNSSHFASTLGGAGSVTISGAGRNVGISKVPLGYTISGYVKTSGGAAVPFASVDADGPGGSSTSTDSSGHYRIVGLSPGSYTVVVTAPFGQNLQSGYYDTAASGDFTPTASAATKVSVGPNRTLSDVRLPVGLTISGKITGPGGVAVPDAFVAASGTAGSESSATDSSGNYRIVGLSPGAYTLSVQAPFSSSTSALASGYYDANVATTHYTPLAGSATKVTV